MKKNKIEDERIISQRRRIQSDAYQILVYCLLASILIQQFILHAPFSQFAFEFFCIIGMGIYISIRYLSTGIDIWGSNTLDIKKLLISNVILGASCAIGLIFLAGEKNIINLVSVCLSISAFSFFSQLFWKYISRKKQKLIDESLDAEETEE